MQVGKPLVIEPIASFFLFKCVIGGIPVTSFFLFGAHAYDGQTSQAVN